MIEKRSVKVTLREWLMLKKRCFRRDGYRCQVCNFTFPEQLLHPHHIIPRGRIKIDHLDNLLTVCPECHRGIHDHLVGFPSVDDLIEKYRERVERFLKGE